MKRHFNARPPLALHVLHRRIYGHSGHMRSTTMRRLRLVIKVRATGAEEQ
jgi:hypothetical protein